MLMTVSKQSLSLASYDTITSVSTNNETSLFLKSNELVDVHFCDKTQIFMLYFRGRKAGAEFFNSHCRRPYTSANQRKESSKFAFARLWRFKK